MRFLTTSLPGVWLIDLEPHEDQRGFFARTFCEREFSAHGLCTHWPQCNLTHTRQRGMIRGLHYQDQPKAESKLIRCSAGAVFDVVVDVRIGSASYGRWAAFELTAQNGLAVYVPVGFAHGFQCLQDHSEVFYQMSEFYYPELSRGIRWNDSSVGVKWPISDPVLSERDRELPLLTPRP
jgi:dTDP-4-dehydrorhamnose 3,5-epimerase